MCAHARAHGNRHHSRNTSAPRPRHATGASPLGSEERYLTNSREDNSLAKTAKLLAFPPALAAQRMAVLLQPLAAAGGGAPAAARSAAAAAAQQAAQQRALYGTLSALTSMALLEVVAAVAVGALPRRRVLQPLACASMRLCAALLAVGRRGVR
jgi:hypothetical protein